MSKPLTARTMILASVAAGLSVGLVDGTRAALAAHAFGKAAAACVLLVVCLDLILGLFAGLLAAGLFSVVAWGARGTFGRAARILGHLLTAGLGGAVGAAAVAMTATRNNRFLASGVVVLAILGSGLLGALLAPVLARLLGRGGKVAVSADAVASRSATAAGLLLAAPLGALAAGLVAFVILWQTRAPLRGAGLSTRMAAVGFVAAVLPWLATALSRMAPAVSRVRAAALALVVFGAPAGVLVRGRWDQDFVFLPWGDIAGGVALLLAAALIATLFRRWVFPLRVTLPLLTAFGALAVACVFTVGAWEPARKPATAHAAMAGAVFGGVRLAFDFDRDGYPRVLGGGDCNDRDADINPGAFDWPDDGIDQDCDGRDARVSALQAPAQQPVPDAVLRDLNILFVTIDTLRADHLGTYGYGRATSPEIDRLAAQATVFDSGWAHAPSTRFSMPALATGRWPPAIAWDDCPACDSWWPRMASSQPTIAQVFSRMGYTTAAFYSYSYFKKDNARGFERGVDVYDDRRADLHSNIAGPQESRGSSSREVADDVIAFLDAQKAKKFFAWVHFYDPHLNYEAHPEAPAFGTDASAAYDGEIWYTDHHLGRVLQRLRDLGLYEKTAVVITGDHGEGLGEHGIHAHGYDLYAPQTKVPVIFRVPGLPPRHVAAPVGHVDIAPTMVNLARGTQEPSFLGRSLLDLIATGVPAGPALTPVFQQVDFEGPTVRRALVSRTHHLIWRVVPDNTTECYDLVADPGELRDLWGTAAGDPACGALKVALGERVADLALHKIADGVSAPGGPVPAPQIPADARIGDVVRFIGHDSSAASVPAGGQVEIVSHFESTKALNPKDGWRMFFHLEGPGGFRNLDHVPVDGAYPLERWRPGQRIRDRQRIGFPVGGPAGTYILYVGLFRRGGERMPVTPPGAADGRDRVPVASITVTN